MTTHRAHGKTWTASAALVAVFALLIQALIPSAAMASQGGGMVICTANGTATVSAPGAPAEKPKGFGGMPCQDCLAAAMMAIAPPELAIRPVAYVVARVEHAAPVKAFEPRARAPPRPPGQGPPTA